MMRSLLGLMLGAMACSLGPGDEPVRADPVADLNLLFIGNSLTYSNDLPGLVAALGDSTGLTIAVRSHTLPDYALEDHWNDGLALRSIEGGGWDFVILQQGPSSLDASRANLIDLATRFGARIRAAGAAPGLYAVWPEQARFGVFDRVTESYRQAAVAAGGVLLPCGEAWRAAWRHDSTLALYSADGLHPSALGSYAAALVIYRRVTGRSVVGLPARVRLASGATVDVPAATAALLQQAAMEVDSLR
jgi:hypothetical protein